MQILQIRVELPKDGFLIEVLTITNYSDVARGQLCFGLELGEIFARGQLYSDEFEHWKCLKFILSFVQFLFSMMKCSSI